MTVPPGESIVKFTPSGFAQLNLQHPRLWWPNGYGSPEHYHLKLALNDMADGVFPIRNSCRIEVVYGMMGEA